MHAKYEKVIRVMGRGLTTDVTRYFVERGLLPGDVPGTSFVDALRRAGLGQADVVLCLLRLNTSASLRSASLLVGKPITYCPPLLAMARRPRAVRGKDGEGDDARVTAVREPTMIDERSARRLLNSPLYDRIGKIRVGMTIAAALSRGVRRRDIRIAVRRGYVTVEA